MKKLFFIFVFLAIVGTAFSTEPACTVPPLPGNLDAFTDTEEMYFDKIMEYYLPAIILESQLKMMNVEPKVKVHRLNSEMLANLDPKYIKYYNKVGFDLYSQIKELQMDVVNKQLFDSETENRQLKKDVTQLMIDTIGTMKYKELYNMLLSSIDKSLSDNKEIEKRFVEKIDKLLNEISSVKYNLTSFEKAKPSYVMTIAGIGEQVMYNSSQINGDIAAGAILTLNTLRIAKDVGVINIWGKYSLLTSENLPLTSNAQNLTYLKYKNDMWSVGGDFELNLSHLFKTNAVNWNLKLGFGYMKGFIRTTNTSLPDKLYNGNLIKLETNLFNFNNIMPFGIVFGANFYKFNSDLIYPTYNYDINLGNPWIPSIYFGLNFNLLKIY